MLCEKRRRRTELGLCFVQIGSRSSVYSPESSVRKTGSYIYEEFMPTDGTDVKVWAKHAEIPQWGAVIVFSFHINIDYSHSHPVHLTI